MSILGLGVLAKYIPEGVKAAAWYVRFKRWRAAKAAKGELDSQKSAVETPKEEEEEER